MSGYVALHRAIWESPHFEDEPFSQREAFMWLVSQAAWKQTRVRFRGKIVTLGRGQLAVTESDLAKRWKWSKSRVHRFLSKMKKQGVTEPAPDPAPEPAPEPTSEPTSEPRFTVISICNYDKYQAARAYGEPTGEPGVNQERTDGEPQNNKDNNLRKEDNPPKPPLEKGGQTEDGIDDGKNDGEKGRGSTGGEHVDPPPKKRERPGRGERWRDELWTDEYWAFGIEHLGSDQVVADQRARFGDYWRGRPGQGGVKLDWLATWRNWVRRAASERSDSNARSPGGGQMRTMGGGGGRGSITQAAANVLAALGEQRGASDGGLKVVSPDKDAGGGSNEPGSEDGGLCRGSERVSWGFGDLGLREMAEDGRPGCEVVPIHRRTNGND